MKDFGKNIIEKFIFGKTKTVSQNSEYCKNCNQHLYLHQNFCHNCGQKTDTHRINFHFLLHEIQHSFLHIDGGIIFTLKQLFTRPGKMLREYLDGKRQPHFKPILTVLILGSIYALISHFTEPKETADLNEVQEEKLLKKSLDKYGDGSQLFDYFSSVVTWITEHFAIMILILLPVTAFAFYLVFRKYKIFYAEWLVVLCYLSAQTLAVYTAYTILDLLPFDFSFLCFIAIAGLFIWTMLQFFQGKKRSSILMRTLFAGFLSFILNGIYVGILAVSLLFFGITKYGKDGKFKHYFDKNKNVKVHLEKK